VQPAPVSSSARGSGTCSSEAQPAVPKTRPRAIAPDRCNWPIARRFWSADRLSTRAEMRTISRHSRHLVGRIRCADSVRARSLPDSSDVCLTTCPESIRAIGLPCDLAQWLVGRVFGTAGCASGRARAAAASARANRGGAARSRFDRHLPADERENIGGRVAGTCFERGTNARFARAAYRLGHADEHVARGTASGQPRCSSPGARRKPPSSAWCCRR